MRLLRRDRSFGVIMRLLRMRRIVSRVLVFLRLKSLIRLFARIGSGVQVRLRLCICLRILRVRRFWCRILRCVVLRNVVRLRRRVSRVVLRRIDIRVVNVDRLHFGVRRIRRRTGLFWLILVLTFCIRARVALRLNREDRLELLLMRRRVCLKKVGLMILILNGMFRREFCDDRLFCYWYEMYDLYCGMSCTIS